MGAPAWLSFRTADAVRPRDPTQGGAVSRRIEGLRRSGRRRRTLVGVVVALAATGIFAISALAVHDLNFQLDGDVEASTTTNVGGNTQNIDWDSLFDSAGAEK